jgi:hypothetical protein
VLGNRVCGMQNDRLAPLYERIVSTIHAPIMP